MTGLQIFINGEETARVYGMAINDLIKLHQKLRSMDMELPDILEFLDREKVILFSEQLEEIKCLEGKLSHLRRGMAELSQDKL